jgi:hypothetical protein
LSHSASLLARLLIELFIWDIELFISKISVFSGLVYLYGIARSHPALSSLFNSAICFNSL